MLAVHEAITNVFRHAYPIDASGACRVVVERRDREVVVTVEDDGVDFDPETCNIEHPEDESGRGFRIIRTLVDRVDCRRTATGGAHVELTLALN